MSTTITDSNRSNNRGQVNCNPEKIRIIIADDHPVYREGLAMIVNTNMRMSVIGEADNGRQLIQIAKQYAPDVVLSDIKMPDIDGIQAIREILSLYPLTRCVLLSQYDNDQLILDAVEAGAYGYLVKTASKNEVFEAIESVYAFRQYYCKFASSRLAKLISRSIYNIVPQGGATLVFSDKEKQVISLLCEEKSSDEIGKILFMSRRTVEGHKGKIMSKIGIKTTVGIVVYAIRNGLYNLEK